jgi:hypothetical protein
VSFTFLVVLFGLRHSWCQFIFDGSVRFDIFDRRFTTKKQTEQQQETPLQVKMMTRRFRILIVAALAALANGRIGDPSAEVHPICVYESGLYYFPVSIPEDGRGKFRLTNS